MIRKTELAQRIMDLELICENYDNQLSNLNRRVKKLEKIKNDKEKTK